MHTFTHDNAINMILGMSPAERENDETIQNRYKDLTGRDRGASDIRLDLAIRTARISVGRLKLGKERPKTVSAILESNRPEALDLLLDGKNMDA